MGLPIFVVSHDNLGSINKDGEFIFVTSSIETAQRQAKSKAGDKNIWIFGGENIAQQFLKWGLIDEISNWHYSNSYRQLKTTVLQYW